MEKETALEFSFLDTHTHYTKAIGKMIIKMVEGVYFVLEVITKDSGKMIKNMDTVLKEKLKEILVLLIQCMTDMKVNGLKVKSTVLVF